MTRTFRPRSAHQRPGPSLGFLPWVERVEPRQLLAVFPIGQNVSATEGIAETFLVARFTSNDPPPQSPTNYTAAINWGDGTPVSPGTITVDPNTPGTFDVTGSHTYAEETTSPHTLSIVVNDMVDSTSATASALATVVDAPLQGSGAILSGLEGQVITGTLATFTDANPTAPLTDFTATISWADGTTSAGTISQPGGVGTLFIVTGSHFFGDESTLPASVTIRDIGGSHISVLSAVVAGEADVLSGLGIPISGTEGIAFSGPVATFTTTYLGNTASDFQAKITWGDGITSTGTVTGSAGRFTISGTHTYADEGNFPVNITLIDDPPGTATITITTSASIAEADELSGEGLTISPVEGNAFNGAVATFTDANTHNRANDFIATIDWGDGTTTGGTVTGGFGTFTVSGAHTYAEEGRFVTQITLADDPPGTARATVAGLALVQDAPLTPITLPAVNETAGQPFSLAPIVAFQDGNPTAPVTDFTATINWADGTASGGQVVAGTPAGIFLVNSPSHTYSLPGDYVVTVPITDIGGSHTTATRTIHVVPAVLSFTVVNTNDSGPGSLRQAILNSNAHPGTDLIDFRIPELTAQATAPVPEIIRLISPLPPVTDPVVIDAYTQPGARPNTLASGDNANILVAVDGSALGTAAHGLVIVAGHTTVRGLAIDHFGGWGIVIGGKGNNQIQGDFLGTDALGIQAQGNGGDGVLVVDVPGNSIGGTRPQDRNLLSGNVSFGVQIAGSDAIGNVIQGNFIGTDRTGARALGNAQGGVFLNNAPSNLVGGTAPGAANLISGNGSAGVEIFGSASTADAVQGNLIGTDLTGASPLGNVNIGVLINNAPGNLVGGTTPQARNIISGNRAGGPPTPPNTPAEQTGAGGVVVIGGLANGNIVQGNYLGTDLSGTRAVPNAYDGVDVSAGSRNIIGGSGPGQGNLISGNGFVGVRLVGPDGSGNVVQGNLIGTNVTGAGALGNGADGVFLNNAPRNIIGGLNPGAGNVISGNRGDGVQAFGAASTGNLIVGNFIGTDRTGQLRLGNAFDGVFLNNAPGNFLGAALAGAGNIISNNGFSGIDIVGQGASGNAALGNLINANAAYGVLIQNATANTIGGTTPGSANTITGNAFGGIQVTLGGNPVPGPGTAGNFIRSNQVSGNGRGPFRLGVASVRKVR